VAALLALLVQSVRGLRAARAALEKSRVELTAQRSQVAHLTRVAMLGELSGSVAHELNQPLTAIMSNAQAGLRFLARGECDLDEVRGILADVVEEDKRAGEVLRRLRLLLKRDQGQRRPLDTNEAVQDVLGLVRGELSNLGVCARADLAADLPSAHADRVQVQQVVLNLVMNACEAMAAEPADERLLVVRTWRLPPDGICVSVSDRGPGLCPEAREKVFEPFFTTKPQGMGLGLTVCRTIVTAGGGRLWATANEDRGSTFHFTLPLE
jgi:C4-dicarboxylate-specific signal transduction histidine kinase